MWDGRAAMSLKPQPLLRVPLRRDPAVALLRAARPRVAGRVRRPAQSPWPRSPSPLFWAGRGTAVQLVCVSGQLSWARGVWSPAPSGRRGWCLSPTGDPRRCSGDVSSIPQGGPFVRSQACGHWAAILKDRAWCQPGCDGAISPAPARDSTSSHSECLSSRPEAGRPRARLRHILCPARTPLEDGTAVPWQSSRGGGLWGPDPIVTVSPSWANHHPQQHAPCSGDGVSTPDLGDT